MNTCEIRLDLRSPAACLSCQPVHLFLIRKREFRHQFGSELISFQGLEDARLDLLAADRSVILADMHGGHRTDIDCVQDHAVELQLVVQAGHVRELARQAIEGLDDHHIESSSSRLRQQLSIAGSVAAGAGERAILNSYGSGSEIRSLTGMSDVPVQSGSLPPVRNVPLEDIPASTIAADASGRFDAFRMLQYARYGLFEIQDSAYLPETTCAVSAFTKP